MTSFAPLLTTLSNRNVNQPGFWESVMPSKLGPAKPDWMTFDDAWVNEVRRGLIACKVFLWYPLYCKYPPLFPQPLLTNSSNVP